MADPLRVLLLADTHLGFDLPTRPRVQRRRRGEDFQANYEAALAPARSGAVDLVIHGGDLFHRPRVDPGLAWQGLRPLVEVAEAGVPVVVVPGNHERSRIPHARFARHPRVHVFQGPGVLRLEVAGVRTSVVGIPYQRRGVRSRFPALVRGTGWRPGEADVSLLCLHQCVEGARVGPSDFTFTTGDDVIRARDLPAGFAAVLSGHIHRHQVLTRDLRGSSLPAPVLYPGSVERTSTAERGEAKGFVTLEVGPGDPGDGPSAAGPPLRWRFHPLPARPMRVRELDLDGLDGAAIEERVRAIVAGIPPDSVLRLRTRGVPADPAARGALAVATLRRIAPATMNIEVRDANVGYRRHRRGAAPEAGPVQGTLALS